MSGDPISNLTAEQLRLLGQTNRQHTARYIVAALDEIGGPTTFTAVAKHHRAGRPVTPETFDPAPLVAAMEPMSLRAVARRLDIDPAMLCRPLTSAQADRFATRLGMHPIEVWGATWSRPRRKSAMK